MKKIITFLFVFSLLSIQSLKSDEIYIGIDYLNNTIDTGITNISSNLDGDDIDSVNVGLSYSFSYINFNSFERLAI